jgi:hypothetical protein
MTNNNYKCIIEFYNNNNSKYSIKTNIQLLRYQKDEDNIQILLPTKEDIITFEFDTLEEDIYINLKIENIEELIIKNENDLRLNHIQNRYRRRQTYKIKWDLKINKKKIKVKSIIINKIEHSYIYEFLKKYAVVL